jgi:hypothetical protein
MPRACQREGGGKTFQLTNGKICCAVHIRNLGEFSSATAHPGIRWISFAPIHWLCRRFITALRWLLEVLVICRVLLSLTLSWSLLLSTPPLISLLIYHASVLATSIPNPQSRPI